MCTCYVLDTSSASNSLCLLSYSLGLRAKQRPNLVTPKVLLVLTFSIPSFVVWFWRGETVLKDVSKRKEIKNENVEPLTQLTGQMQKDWTLVDRAHELLKGLEGLWG